MSNIWSWLKAHPAVFLTLIAASFLSVVWVGAFGIRDGHYVLCVKHSTHSVWTLDVGTCSLCGGRTGSGMQSVCGPCASAHTVCTVCGSSAVPRRLFGALATLSPAQRTVVSPVVLALAVGAWLAAIVLLRRALRTPRPSPPADPPS